MVSLSWKNFLGVAHGWMAAKYENGSVSLYIDFSGLLLNICLFLILYLEDVFNVKTSKFYDELKQNYPTLRVSNVLIFLYYTQTPFVQSVYLFIKLTTMHHPYYR